MLCEAETGELIAKHPIGHAQRLSAANFRKDLPRYGNPCWHTMGKLRYSRFLWRQWISFDNVSARFCWATRNTLSTGQMMTKNYYFWEAPLEFMDCGMAMAKNLDFCPKNRDRLSLPM